MLKCKLSCAGENGAEVKQPRRMAERRCVLKREGSCIGEITSEYVKDTHPLSCETLLIPLADLPHRLGRETQKVTLAPPRKVCMANNTVFDKDQIPVPVQDRTYYGCCAMCRKMLETDPKNRTAGNPV